MNKTILLVEDEVSISNIEMTYLKKSNFNVLQAFDGQEALDIFNKEKIDLIVLDLMIPKISGEALLRKIREFSDIPIIIVTAKISEDDILANFKNGADDYIKKPFSGNELVERVKSIFRRLESFQKKNAYIISEDRRLKIDKINHRITKDDKEVSLTKNELLILETLFSNPNKTFTRNEIIDVSFGYDYDAFDRAIDTHIKNIRQKIEDDPRSPVYIKTAYGIGYKAGEVCS